MLKAVIFDMDGLLIDSEPLWEDAEIAVFGKIGVPMTRERTAETMGLRIDEVVNHWFTRYPWSKPSQKEVADKIVGKVIQLINTKGQAHQGAMGLIKLLQSHRLSMAIASSSPLVVIRAVIDKMGIKEIFQVICSAEQEIYGKPHPGVYLTTAGKLGVDPKECLVFEDSPNGVKAAKAAGMKCIAIPSEKVKKDAGFKLADKILNSLTDFSLDILTVI